MKVTPIEKSPGKNLYEEVANHIESLIKEGTLQSGDRLPSVRKLHNQMSVSISTVLEAYRVLEDRGLIEVRPQSGYYVKHHCTSHPDEPNQSVPPKKICLVDASLALRINAALKNPKTIKLGAAVAAVELFPIAPLNRLIGQVLRNQPIESHSYTPLPGCESLRHEIARRMMEAGCSVTPDEIIVTNGTCEGIFLSLRAIAKPGDTIAIESPTYYGLLEIFQSLQLKALELPTHPRDGLSLEHLEKAIAQGKINACALVSNFSNPLGSCMSDEKKQQLVELLAKYEIPLIEDDVYGELYFQGDSRPKALKAFDRDGWVLYCSSFSKTLSPGLRVGWAVPGPYQKQVEQFKFSTNLSTATVPQLAIAAFLANGGFDRHLRQLRRAYHQQMMRMIQAICDYFPAETKITRPNGGHVLWVELPLGFDSMQLYEEACKHNISIAPGSMFSPSGGYANCFRLNAGLPWSEEIEGAMKTLGLMIKRQLAMQILKEENA